MVTLNTLNTLVDDIMLIVRNSNISASESINRLQVEQWIHHYRAKLIKEELDRDGYINPSYIQYLDGVYLNEGNTSSSNSDLTIPCRYVTSIDIPKTIKTNNSNGILSVTDSIGNEIQITSIVRLSKQKYRKYTCYDYLAIIKDNKIYIDGPGYLEYINIALIPEDPSTISDCDFSDKPYPMPASKIDTLKKLILETELNIMLKMPSDNTNNTKNDLENITVKNG